MAKRLDTFVQRRSKYDWESLTDGQPWRLASGTDYTVPSENFQRYAHNYATRHGLRVRTSADEDSVTIQFQTKNVEAA